MVAGAAAKARFRVIEGVAILIEACEGVSCGLGWLERLRRSLFEGRSYLGGGGCGWRGKGGGKRGRMTSWAAAVDNWCRE